MKKLFFGLVFVVFILYTGRGLWAVDDGVSLKYVRSDEDIDELVKDDELTQERGEALKRLLRHPINLSECHHPGELYELPKFTFSMGWRLMSQCKTKPPRIWKDLLKIKDITQEVIEEIKPFSTIGKPAKVKKKPIKIKKPEAPKEKPEEEEEKEYQSRFRLKTIETLQDANAPSSYLQADIDYKEWFSGGVIVLGQEAVGRTHYDEDEEVLIAKEKEWRPSVPKIYGELRKGAYKLNFGSFRCGFGQKLVFDNSGKTFPNGCAADNLIYERTESAEYAPPEGLFGIAIQKQYHKIKKYAFDGTLALSFADYDAYQGNVKYLGENEDYGLYPEEKIETEAKYSYETIPDAFQEALAVGHLTFYFAEQSYIGFTGYAAWAKWLIGDDEVFNFSYPPIPNDRNIFGAYGLDFGTDFGLDIEKVSLYLFGEFARTDSGGNGLLLKTLLESQKLEFLDSKFITEFSFRSYGKEIDNPHSRGLSNADQYLRDSDRDEHGLFLKFIYEFTALRKKEVSEEEEKSTAALLLRIWLLGNIWKHFGMQDKLTEEGEVITEETAEEETGEVTDAEVSGRLDAQLPGIAVFSVWTRVHNEDIAVNGREQNEEKGEKYSITGQIAAQYPFKEDIEASGAMSRPLVKVILNYRREWEDVSSQDFSQYDEEFQPNQSAWVRFWFALPWEMEITTRLRFYDEDTNYKERKEQSWWWYAELARAVPFAENLPLLANSFFSLRYGLFYRSDTRESTEELLVNPEHQFRITVFALF